MGRATLDEEYVGPDSWAFHAFEPFSGVDTGTSFWGSDLVNIPKLNMDIVIDGIVIVIANGGAQAYAVQVNTTQNIPHVIMSGSTAAGGGAYEILTPIGMPARIHNGSLIKVTMTTAALDVITITAWGHWQALAQTKDNAILVQFPYQQPQDVNLSGIKWPWK